MPIFDELLGKFVTDALSSAGGMLLGRRTYEYRLIVHPIVMGKGKRLFPDDEPMATMKLVDSRPTTSGVGILTYVPVDGPPTPRPDDGA